MPTDPPAGDPPRGVWIDDDEQLEKELEADDLNVRRGKADEDITRVRAKQNVTKKYAGEKARRHSASAHETLSSFAELGATDPLSAFRLMGGLAWEEVSIILRSDGMVQITARDKSVRVSSAQIGLVDRGGSGKANRLYALLLGFARGQYFDSAEQKDRQLLSRTRRTLRSKLGISSDPFERKTESGWKPRFSLKDRTRAADERAERNAVHQPFDDDKQYAKEGDEAGRWLEENDR